MQGTNVTSLPGIYHTEVSSFFRWRLYFNSRTVWNVLPPPLKWVPSQQYQPQKNWMQQPTRKSSRCCYHKEMRQQLAQMCPCDAGPAHLTHQIAQPSCKLSLKKRMSESSCVKKRIHDSTSCSGGGEAYASCQVFFFPSQQRKLSSCLLREPGELARHLQNQPPRLFPECQKEYGGCSCSSVRGTPSRILKTHCQSKWS